MSFDIVNALLTGFFLAFMVGPVFFVLLETSATKGIKEAIFFDLGVILADEDLDKTPVDEFGHVQLGGISERIANIIEKELGIPTRHVILGHVQRGGSPSPIDRIIPQGQGIMATELIEKGEFGFMVGVKEGKLTPLPLESVVGRIRPVPSHIIELYKPLFEE